MAHRRVTYACVAALLAGAAVAAPPSPEYQLVWQDEFEGDAINTSNWRIAQNFTHGMQEWQLYMADECSVANGNLVLRTRVNPTHYGSKLYNLTSCWVDSWTHNQWSYGYYEFKAQLPSSNASGIWPALWLVNDFTDCWPVGGEIDVMESVGGFKNGSIFGTYHYGVACGKDEYDGHNGVYPPWPYNPPFPYTTSYHTFAAEWTPSNITWFMDGIPYITRTQGVPADLFIAKGPMYMIINVASSFWGGPGVPQPPPLIHYPTEMLVEYARVYQTPAQQALQAQLLAEQQAAAAGAADVALA